MYNYDLIKDKVNNEILYLSGYFQDNFNDFAYINRKDQEMINFSKNNNENGFIIVISGCFAPIHIGHINMIDVAKKYIEEKHNKKYGFSILFPSHDSYVNSKTNLWTIDKRINYFNENFKDKHIYFDYKPAKELQNDINFTYLVQKVRNNFKNNDIYFVFGGDNFMFHIAFHNTDINTISITRYNDKIDNEKISIVEKFKEDYIHINHNDYKNISSTLIRK